MLDMNLLQQRSICIWTGNFNEVINNFHPENSIQYLVSRYVDKKKSRYDSLEVIPDYKLIPCNTLAIFTALVSLLLL
jgi:hypothetical protein